MAWQRDATESGEIMASAVRAAGQSIRRELRKLARVEKELKELRLHEARRPVRKAIRTREHVLRVMGMTPKVGKNKMAKRPTKTASKPAK